MKYSVRVYVCQNAAQLVAAVQAAKENELQIVVGKDTLNLPGVPAPIPVFRRYPRSILNALLADPSLDSPEMDDVVLDAPSVDGPTGDIFPRPVLLLGCSAED